MAPERKRGLVVPREHGAWGILLVPLVTGGAVSLWTGGSGWGLAPLTVAALALFWLRTPLESWMGSTPVRARTAAEFTLVRNSTFALTALAAAALAWLFWDGRHLGLLGLGVAVAAAFLTQTLVKLLWRGARAAAQMVGAAGLTATAPAAYYVVTGHWGVTAWSLWMANLLFSLNQIQFVQMRIHAARVANRREKLAVGWTFLAGQMLLIALLAAGCADGYLPWYAALAFLPVLYRGFAWFAAKAEALAVHALGKSELAYACAFGVLLVVGMQLGTPLQ